MAATPASECRAVNSSARSARRGAAANASSSPTAASTSCTPAHVGYLNEARQLGDRLIVAVNDDDSARRVKGYGRPVNRLERRMRVLEGLAAVDWVVPFSEDTPEALLAEIRPDVLVKGGDYALHEVIGGDFVRGYGGDVRVLGLVEGCSTSGIVEHIKATAG